MFPNSDNDAVLLGRDPATGEPITLGPEGHVLTIAPTGGGKGVSALIPALLTHPGQAIVLDCKGEAVAVTRRYREEVLGQDVVVLDPFGIGDASGGALNPFDMLPANASGAGGELRAFSNLLAPVQDASGDPYWSLAGRQLICGLLAHYLDTTPAPVRNLAGFLELGSRMVVEPKLLGLQMAQSSIAEVRSQGQVVLSSASGQDTARDVVSHADTLLSGLRGRVTAQATARTSFDLDALRDGRPMTIYIVIPPNRLPSSARLLRLWLGTLSALLLGRRARPACPTLLLIDEAAQLGHLDLFVTAMTLYRGYGVQCWSFWQDLDQLRATYPHDWRTILNNAAAVQAFAPSCPSMAGEFRLLMPRMTTPELMALRSDELVLARAGRAGEIVRRINYLQESVLEQRADPNPWYASAA